MNGNKGKLGVGSQERDWGKNQGFTKGELKKDKRRNRRERGIIGDSKVRKSERN